MGRRALTSEGKADKLERERERARKRRLGARQNKQAHHIQPNLDDSHNTRLVTDSSDTLPETISYSPTDNGDQSNPTTLDLVDEQPPPTTHRGSRSLGIANRPASTIYEPAPVASETDLRPEASAGPPAPIRLINKQTFPNPNHAAAAHPATTHQSRAAGQDEGKRSLPGRPRLDLAISPRARTRLRVQRYRDQQHLGRVQQLIQEVADTQELPPTVEFSDLALRDDLTPSPPAQTQSWSGPEVEFEAVSLPLSSTASLVDVEDSHGDDTGSSSPDTNAVLLLTAPVSPSPGLPRQDGRSSRPRSSTSSISDLPDWFVPSASPSLGPENPILDSFIQAIHDQDTAGGPDFLRARGDLYDRVLRTFFNHQCECKSSDPTLLSCRGAYIMLKLGPNSRELAEPEHTHTLQERIERLGHSLPPLPAVFAERNNACDPRASFPHWQSFLSDQPAEPLSFRKTQASLSQNSVTVARQWDVDSIWFGARSLSAIRAPNRFRLSFFPPHQSNISTNQVIQPHGLDLAHTRHTCIGSFTTAGVRFSVFVFFPHGARSQTRAAANSLSLARFRDLYDEIILPAVYETVPDHALQEIPGSYDLIYAKSRAYQEKPGAGRWSAEDESRAFRLAYDVPASALPRFWTSIVERANLHRVQTRRGEDIAYFQNPRLLFQSHDLKNIFARPSLHESLCLFRDIILAGLDPNQLDMRSCWLDVGMRDHVTRPPSSPDAQGSAEPWTLLWKSDCCRHLHEGLQDLVPEAPLDAKHYRSFLLRDAGTYYAKARPSRASNPGHPDARSPGIIRAKAYNCSKDPFGVMFSNYQLFSSGHLPLLSFDDGMLKDLAEVTFRLDVILAMWADGALEPSRSPHTGPMAWDVPLDDDGDGDDDARASGMHCPFWVIPTKVMTSFVSTQAARLILPLDHIFQEATRKEGEQPSSSTDPVRQILAFYTAQLFCRLLIYALDDEEEEQNFDNWIWRSVWTVRTRGRGEGSVKERRGLGLGAHINASGMLWIPHGHIDWQRGHISLEVLVNLYMSRSPLQARLAHQPNVQALTTTQVTVELLFQQLVRDARGAYDQGRDEEAEKLASRAIVLAVEETARAYHQHFLAKVESYWDRVRGDCGRQKLPVLARLRQAQVESAAETSRIPTAQTIHGIYTEAWAKYGEAVPSDNNIDPSAGDTLPDELPCWMTTRRRLPPKNSWSDFLFNQLFGRPKPPAWDRLYFLQVYRAFKDIWQRNCEPAGPFDSRFSVQIGRYIHIAFNSDHSKEVGTSHGPGTWHHDKPSFFQIQYWAPYFSPPRGEEDTFLSSVYRRRDYPEGLSPDMTPMIPSPRNFQGLERAAWPHWVEIMGDIDRLRSAGHDTIRRHCRRALLYVTYLAGPTWGRDGDLDRLGLYLNQPEPAILCIQCKFALKADGDRVSRHLGERHGISKLARRGLGPFIRTLRLPDPKTLPVRSDGSSPHPHLRIQQGAACRHCGLRSTSLEVLSRHLKEVHPQDIQHSRGRGFPESHWLQDHILDRLTITCQKSGIASRQPHFLRKSLINPFFFDLQN
ncbi:hypothetical protein MRS44_018677 [Fusarium solani]|uniref:uncharacterized protein n=1 Tax=Fusarium solani TaxID=169388 RepID=UPI0032C4686D|nr:hypothetical protein MRS44_018677 [Fusarium solani]